MTLAPSVLNRCAIALPIPFAPPVTSAVLLASSIGSCGCLS